MNRRSFLKSAVAVPIGANFSFPGKRRDRPNLLFLWTDQQRADTMAVYGNARIRVPSLNKLAGESVVFERPYVTQPVCTPSRSTVMTGMWPHSNGCVENNIRLDPKVQCLPELLGDADYRTGYFGKWHLGDEAFAQHGFQEWESIEDIYRDYFSPGREKRFSSYHHFLEEKGYRPDQPDGSFGRLFEARLPIEHCKPKFLEERACDFLRRHRAGPFMLCVNFLEPHPPYFGPLNGEYRTDEIPVPPNYADALEDDEPLVYRLKRERARELRSEGMDLRTDEGWRQLRAHYWGNVTHVDRSLGAILTTLEQLDLARNTIVVFTSDHGEMLGAHGLVQKSVMYEEALRIPWLIRVPGAGRKHRVVKGRFSQIDLVPTVLDLMGRPSAGRFPGRSLVPRFSTGDAGSEPVFIEWNAPLKSGADEFSAPRFQTEEIQRAVRSNTRTAISQDGWKLCLSDGDKSQLFDLNTDPWETRNLFYSGSHGGKVAQLTKTIRRWQETAGDKPRIVTNQQSRDELRATGVE